tara:strand:+ start:3345 stop:3989 length:645 start_codon:yes stop_codon:yes gene_type:complete
MRNFVPIQSNSGSLGTTSRVWGSLVVNNITASNNISASGTIYGNVISASGGIYADFVEISSSVVYTSGSNIFGSDPDDIHEFTGSVAMANNLTVEGNVSAPNLSGIISGSGQVADMISGSWAGQNFLGSSSTGSFMVGSDTGSMGNLNVVGSISASGNVNISGSLNVTGKIGGNNILGGAFETDGLGDIMPTTETTFTDVLYEVDESNDIMPRL